MSGPPLPRLTSNVIGKFQIGISPIGDLPPFDVWQTVISQYANSPALSTIVTKMLAWLDQTPNFISMYDDIWNVNTAQGYGLDVWGRILGTTRIVPIPGGLTYFGFQEGGGQPFGQSTFYVGVPSSANFNLSDSSFKLLLNAKILANISDGSIPSINAILLALFPNRGNCYCTDGGNMTMTYTFAFALSVVELAIVSESGILPKPAGVLATVVHP